jgi:tripartite-type tricarboxylate transporter receptor subunit TctC
VVSLSCSKNYQLRKRALLFALTTLLFCSLAPGIAHTQDSYPSQTIKLVVPFAPGGLPDTVARIIAPSLQEKLKQSVVVENRPGSGGGVATVAIEAAPADGYQFLVTDNTFLSVNPFIYKQLSYNPKNITTVGQIAYAPLFLAVYPKVPAKTFKEFIDYARANPGKISYGSSGIGTAHHLSMEAIKAALKLEMTHVPFRGTGQSVPALLGGHIDALFSAYPSLSGAVQGGQLLILATNGAVRSPQAPKVPAVSEIIPGFDFAPRIGVYARRGTPDAILQRIAAEVIATTQETETINRFAGNGIEAAGSRPDEFRKVLDDEIKRVEATIKSANIEPQ